MTEPTRARRDRNSREPGSLRLPSSRQTAGRYLALRQHWLRFSRRWLGQGRQNLVTLSRRQVSHSSALAQLKSADVGDDLPPVRNLYLRLVIGHRSKSIGDHVEEITQRGLAQAINVVRRWAAETALHDHSIAVTGL